MGGRVSEWRVGRVESGKVTLPAPYRIYRPDSMCLLMTHAVKANAAP